MITPKVDETIAWSLKRLEEDLIADGVDRVKARHHRMSLEIAMRRILQHFATNEELKDATGKK